MRTKILILFPLCLLAAAAVWAAAAGDAADPLASLSYLNGVFASKVDAAVDARLENAGGAFADSGGTAAPIGTAVSWTESRLKRDDILQSVTGDGVLLLAGSVQVSYASGAVVDVTDGTVLPSGGSLAVRHRYLVAEDTAAAGGLYVPRVDLHGLQRHGGGAEGHAPLPRQLYRLRPGL